MVSRKTLDANLILRSYEKVVRSLTQQGYQIKCINCPEFRTAYEVWLDDLVSSLVSDPQYRLDFHESLEKRMHSDEFNHLTRKAK